MKKNKNIIIITGGAGFVGSNLISLLLKKTNLNIISLDNYSTGNKKNHINDCTVKMELVIPDKCIPWKEKDPLNSSDWNLCNAFLE